jgi:hypothetical protein
MAQGSGNAGESGALVVELSPDMGYVAAKDLHARLMGVTHAPDVTLDASNVEKLSTAAVLVITSFLNAREAFTPPAAVKSPSGPFVDAFSELGLFGSLMRMEFRT